MENNWGIVHVLCKAVAISTQILYQLTLHISGFHSPHPLHSAHISAVRSCWRWDWQEERGNRTQGNFRLLALALIPYWCRPPSKTFSHPTHCFFPSLCFLLFQAESDKDYFCIIEGNPTNQFVKDKQPSLRRWAKHLNRSFTEEFIYMCSKEGKPLLMFRKNVLTTSISITFSSIWRKTSEKDVE